MGGGETETMETRKYSTGTKGRLKMHSDGCKEIIKAEMKDFVENYIMQFENCHDVLVHFVGSIAFYLKEELEIALDAYDIKVGNVLRRPIDGLIQYHILNK